MHGLRGLHIWLPSYQTHSSWNSSVISTALPKLPGVAFNVTHHFGLVGKVHFPQQRPIPKYPNWQFVLLSLGLVLSVLCFITWEGTVHGDVLLVLYCKMRGRPTKIVLDLNQMQSGYSYRLSQNHAHKRNCKQMASFVGAVKHTWPTIMSNMAVCIECGQQSSKQLFRQYTGGAIQLMRCVSTTSSYYRSRYGMKCAAFTKHNGSCQMWGHVLNMFTCSC